jgi:hypothetical protein
MAKLPLVLSWALVTISLIGFADLFTYSFADEFLSSLLISKGATTGQLVLAYGIEGMATTAAVLLVSPLTPAYNKLVRFFYLWRYDERSCVAIITRHVTP